MELLELANYAFGETPENWNLYIWRCPEETERDWEEIVLWGQVQMKL